VNLNGLRKLSVTRAAVDMHGESLGEAPEQARVRRVSRIVVLCSLALLFLLCGAVSASAHVHYLPTGSFGEAGSGAGQSSLSTSSGVAINSETHDLYIADTGNNRIDEFEADGKFVRAWGWGVENGAAELQTCAASCQKGLSGTAPGEFEAPRSIAIDGTPGGNGDVYVANAGKRYEGREEFSADIISKFNSEGKLIESWGVKGQLHETQLESHLHKMVAKSFGQIRSIGVDVSGSLWVSSGPTNTESGPEEGLGDGEHMSVFDQSGSFIAETFNANGAEEVFKGEENLSFDSSDNLYGSAGSYVFRYSVITGELSGLTGSNYGPAVTGVAVDRVADDIYVDAGESIERFVSGCPAVGNEFHCVPLESFGSPEAAGGGALAVDSETGIVYVLKPGSDEVDVFTPEIPLPPTIESESVSAVTGDSVTFGLKIEPNGPVTSYRVEYGPTASYGENVPAPDGVVGSGFAAQELSLHVQGLAAQTTYHFRVVAYNAKGTVYGEDRTFTTQSPVVGSVLSDGRQWELVTPAEKLGSLFYAQNVGAYDACASACPFVAEASVNGDAMVDLASAPTESEPSGYVKEASVLSTRGPDGGWSSQVISPRHEQAAGPYIASGGEYVFFSEDLSTGIIAPFGPFTALSPEASESTPYRRTNYLEGNVDKYCESTCYRPLVTQADTPGGEKFGGETAPGAGCPAPLYVCGPRFAAATPDAKYVVLKAEMHLTATPNEGAGGGEPYYYEWGNGELQPLDLLPESEGGEGVGIGAPSAVTHELSDDGSVFFDYGGHLYLHDFAKKESVRLDVAQGVAEPATGEASFIYAASDGSRMLFSDSQVLTEAPEGGIYECQIVENAGVPGCDLKLTTLTSGATSGTLLGGSKDATYLYFDNANHLIVDHYGNSEWTTTNGPYVGPWPESPAVVAGLPNLSPTFEISPDGRWLTFMSEEKLTGYDNRDAVSGQPDIEVYIYGAESNKVVCASCNPTGARPVGVEYDQKDLVAGSLERGWAAANLPPWTKATYATQPEVKFYETRFLSDSGRLFFNSHDALVPQDIDGTQDVYEWEPPGVGDCTTSASGFSEHSGGCVSLISSGTSVEESAFMDASGSGGDVFFITLTKLVSQDFDNAMDVYDAHECTAQSPCTPQPATVPPACSTGDACKAAPTPQPSIFGAPSSATFSGAGNVSPPGRPAAKKVKSKPLTRAQKLTRALKACAKERRAQRAGCKRAARKRYGKVANRGKRG
jgi:hypothetical protein